MARIRNIEIQNFRTIRNLNWCPSAGINCLIGPGDSGKSTILDAIDFCLGARRNLAITDTDFYTLDVTQPISISITLGGLPESMLNIDKFGDYLRGFEAATGNVEDEPRKGLETVLTVNLTVKADLEPVWSLFSERTADADPPFSLSWKERVAIAPSRLGNHPNSNLSWTRGSVLNRLSEERADISAELIQAARDARAGFGTKAAPQLAATLQMVTDTAHKLGVPIGSGATALLDAHSVSFGDGAISLHSAAGIPLRYLGTGSTRLLIAGLHRAAANTTNIVLVDEIEYGLEPHRLTRLLGSLGAKETSEPLQVFMTSHSPVVLRELAGNQLFVVRSTGGAHQVLAVGASDDAQSTIRCYPEAFLARTVIICEGASEVGLIRGIDEYWTDKGHRSLRASGVHYIDAGGGDADRCFQRADIFQQLGYRVAAVQDNDKEPTSTVVAAFEAAGGYCVTWRKGMALEDALFASLPAASVTALIERGIELMSEDFVDQHIRTRSSGRLTLATVQTEGMSGNYSDSTRAVLGKASRVKKAGWFKSISKMEDVARDIVGPALEQSDSDFSEVIKGIFCWAHADA